MQNMKISQLASIQVMKEILKREMYACHQGLLSFTKETLSYYFIGRLVKIWRLESLSLKSRKGYN